MFFEEGGEEPGAFRKSSEVEYSLEMEKLHEEVITVIQGRGSKDLNMGHSYGKWRDARAVVEATRYGD